jgi:thiol-disulfide isomerase/thioredoxin
MLETMRPPAEADEFDDDILAALGEDGLVYRVWGGDWCGDCRRQLPGFASALAAAGVSEDRIFEYPVERAADGSKTGERVDEYGIELIPTVVVERDGEEVARFVEEADEDVATHLAAQL